VARVKLTHNLAQLTGGASEVEVEAANIRQLLGELGARYPALEPHLAEGLAVAIDGEIFQDAWLEPIPPESEVHLIPRNAGG
jgi:molybdopterin converting factor small subunit